MPRTPSIVPDTFEQSVYIVLDDFGELLGRAWRETDETRTDRASLIRDLLEGQYDASTRIVAFNTAEGWARDVTGEIANEVAQLMDREEASESLKDFVAEHASAGRMRQFWLPGFAK